jgi:nucleoside-diphosphate-sugar epimerase
VSIIITGATGLIGFDLTKYFSEKYKIIAISKKKKQKTNKKVYWINLNLKKKIGFKLKDKIICIIHCAIDQRFINKDGKKYHNDNVTILKNMIDFASKNHIKYFINISSVDVYGKNKNKILREQDKFLHQSQYGSLKLRLEKLVSKYKYNYVNLRVPGVLCSGSINKGRPWIATTINQMIQHEKVLIYNKKDKFNNVTSSYEIFRFIKYLINNKLKIKKTFNFASNKPEVIENLILFIKKKLSSKSKIYGISEIKKHSFLISNNQFEEQMKFKLKTTKKIILNYILHNNLI